MPKNIRLNSTHDFIMKIPNKQELCQLAFNHSSDIGVKEFMNLYKKCMLKNNQLYKVIIFSFSY